MKEEDKKIECRPELADKLEECMKMAVNLYKANIRGVYFYFISFTTKKGVQDELLLKASKCFKPGVPFGDEQYYEHYQKEIASKYGRKISEITEASAARLVFSIYKDLIEYAFSKIDTSGFSKKEKYMVELFKNIVLSPTKNPSIQIKDGKTKCYYDYTKGGNYEFERDLKNGIEFIERNCPVALEIFRTPDKEQTVDLDF